MSQSPCYTRQAFGASSIGRLSPKRVQKTIRHIIIQKLHYLTMTVIVLLMLACVCPAIIACPTGPGSVLESHHRSSRVHSPPNMQPLYAPSQSKHAHYHGVARITPHPYPQFLSLFGIASGYPPSHMSLQRQRHRNKRASTIAQGSLHVGEQSARARASN